MGLARSENISGEMKANVVLGHERLGMGAQRLGKKFALDNSSATRILQKHREALKEIGGATLAINVPDYQRISIPDEEQQNASEKIAFLSGEAEKYKRLALSLEKKLGLLKRDRDLLRSLAIDFVVKNHEETEVDGNWKMTHDEFMDFYSDFNDGFISK